MSVSRYFRTFRDYQVAIFVLFCILHTPILAEPFDAEEPKTITAVTYWYLQKLGKIENTKESDENIVGEYFMVDASMKFKIPTSALLDKDAMILGYRKGACEFYS